MDSVTSICLAVFACVAVGSLSAVWCSWNRAWAAVMVARDRMGIGRDGWVPSYKVGEWVHYRIKINGEATDEETGR